MNKSWEDGNPNIRFATKATVEREREKAREGKTRSTYQKESLKMGKEGGEKGGERREG